MCVNNSDFTSPYFSAHFPIKGIIETKGNDYMINANPLTKTDAFKVPENMVTDVPRWEALVERAPKSTRKAQKARVRMPIKSPALKYKVKIINDTEKTTVSQVEVASLASARKGGDKALREMQIQYTDGVIDTVRFVLRKDNRRKIRAARADKRAEREYMLNTFVRGTNAKEMEEIASRARQWMDWVADYMRLDELTLANWEQDEMHEWILRLNRKAKVLEEERLASVLYRYDRYVAAMNSWQENASRVLEKKSKEMVSKDGDTIQPDTIGAQQLLQSTITQLDSALKKLERESLVESIFYQLSNRKRARG